MTETDVTKHQGVGLGWHTTVSHEDTLTVTSPATEESEVRVGSYRTVLHEDTLAVTASDRGYSVTSVKSWFSPNRATTLCVTALSTRLALFTTAHDCKTNDSSRFLRALEYAATRWLTSLLSIMAMRKSAL